MGMFVDLTEGEEGEYRKAAREDYRAFTPINGMWHPVYQDECVKINAEVGKSSFASNV